jgi:hypothetical protein
MTAKVGIVEGEEAAIAMQGHNKYVSAATDTQHAVLSMRVLIGNGAVDTFSQQRINSQQYTETCFLCCPPRGYIARATMHAVKS